MIIIPAISGYMQIERKMSGLDGTLRTEVSGMFVITNEQAQHLQLGAGYIQDVLVLNMPTEAVHFDEILIKAFTYANSSNDFQCQCWFKVTK